MRLVILAASVLALASLLGVAIGARGDDPADGFELLKNPRFERGAEGWMLRQAAPAADVRHADSNSVRLDGVEPASNSWSHVGVAVTPVPADRKLRFDCHVRGKSGLQNVSLNVFGYDDDHELTFQSSKLFDLVAGKWTAISNEYVVPAGTAVLTAWIINSSSEAVAVSDAHLRVDGPQKAAPRLPKPPKDQVARPSRPASTPLDGPGVIKAQAQAAVATENKNGVGVLTFPIPGTYRHQVPLTFDLHVEPPEALKGYRWARRPDERNWLCEVTIAPSQAGALVRWEALVLVGRGTDGPLPHVLQPEAPDESAPWTRSTACVQSDDPLIREKANELAKGTEGLEAYARRVIEFTSHHKGKPDAVFDTLDAPRGSNAAVRAPAGPIWRPHCCGRGEFRPARSPTCRPGPARYTNTGWSNTGTPRPAGCGSSRRWASSGRCHAASLYLTWPTPRTKTERLTRCNAGRSCRGLLTFRCTLGRKNYAAHRGLPGNSPARGILPRSRRHSVVLKKRLRN